MDGSPGRFFMVGWVGFWVIFRASARKEDRSRIALGPPHLLAPGLLRSKTRLSLAAFGPDHSETGIDVEPLGGFLGVLVDAQS